MHRGGAPGEAGAGRGSRQGLEVAEQTRHLLRKDEGHRWL